MQEYYFLYMINPFTLISTKKVYENPWISVREDSVIRPGGKEGIFGIIDMKDGVTVIAVDKENNIITTNEFAYAIDDYSLEVVSGGMDDGENPLDCAKRELEEETGYRAKEWIDLWYIDPFTSVIKSRNYIFLARGLQTTLAKPDEWEILNIWTLPYDEALKLALDSKISHWASVIAIIKSQKYLL